MTSSLYLLLAISVLFVVGIGAAFWWAIFAGQFDDTQAAAESVLRDDDNTQSCGTVGSDNTASVRDRGQHSS